MAKFNGNGKRRQNFFSRNIEQYGEDFLSTFNAKQIQNGVMSVFKDMAYGNLEVSKYEPQFLHPNFIEAAITVIDVNLFIHQVHVTSETFLINNDATFRLNERALQVVINDRTSLELYTLLRNNMVSIRETRDLRYLTGLPYQLSKYRYNM